MHGFIIIFPRKNEEDSFIWDLISLNWKFKSNVFMFIVIFNESDFWGLGCLIFEMITGSYPFDLKDSYMGSNDRFLFDDLSHGSGDAKISILDEHIICPRIL